MVKKKKQSAVSGKRLAVSRPHPPTPPQVEDHNLERREVLNYEIGVWAGLTQYRCKFCKFDTLHQSVIVSHIAETHMKNADASTASETSTRSPLSEETQVSPEGDLNGVFEIELEEVSSTVDEQGNEHKTFTIKE